MFDVALENSFDFLADEYRALFESSRATAFQHPLWLDRVYGRLAPRLDAEPLIIAVRWRDDRRLALVLPLLRRRRGGMRVIEFADLGVSDYATPVCADATFALLLGDQAVRERVRDALPSHDLVRILKQRDDALPLDQLLGIGARAPMDMHAHAVALYGPSEKWRLDSIDRSYRKELDKKGRQMRRKGELRLTVWRDRGAIEQSFQRMREHRLPRFQAHADPDLLQVPLFFDFYLELAIAGAGAGLCRTYTLSLDGQPISTVFGLSHARQFLIVLGGFDLAGYRTYSIGALTFDAIAGDCIDKGDTVLDFTIGDESYKQLFGTRPTGLWMMSHAGSRRGALIGFVTERMPWTIKIAKRIVNRRRRPARTP